MSMKSDMVPKNGKKARDSGLITSRQAGHDTTETDTKVDHLSDQPVIARDTSSLHEYYEVDQNICSQENIYIEPHYIPYEITESDIKSETFTAHMSSRKERERAHLAIKEEKKIRKRDLVSTDEKGAIDPGLITSKHAGNDTTEYDIQMDHLSDQPVIARDTSSIHEHYQVDQNIYNQENLKSVPLNISDEITESDKQSETSTEHVSRRKERERTNTTSKDREKLRKRDIVSTDEKRSRDDRLITPKHTVDDTTEYDTKRDRISDQTAIARDTSSFHEHYQVDQNIYSQENIYIEPHNIPDEITESDIKSETSTEHVSSRKERERPHPATKERKILMKSDMVPKDVMKARDSGLITSKQAGHDITENDIHMDICRVNPL
ncbi:Hypothetical predicted protein [Mytilus galloprovincialis]|uniref:Uncharacterized protein n=1 Tax=Mytilus galloprovincialis TaxID=29158 RepID=A0A8B6E5Z2_MYTGA|nr:Hypothetical predicted protein [Mytilus galloprovincialis]